MFKKILFLSFLIPIMADKMSFSQFIKTHDKHYNDTELVHRLSIYQSNIASIEAHNNDISNNWKKGINQFTDLTADEFKNLVSRPLKNHNHNHTHDGKHKPSPSPTPAPQPSPQPIIPIPSEWDWTTQGAVTAIKDQGQCGSCWAFGTAEAIESAWFLKNKQLLTLSEQQLVDCDKTDAGCNGGLPDNAFQYVISNKGLCSESSYPYKGKNGKCQTCQPVASITSFVDVNPTEQDLMQAVARQPVTVAIEADQVLFQSYSQGVLTAACGTNLDHAVVVVGYGTLNGIPYWKVRNSWGTTWGMDGYILLARNVSQNGGQCGILMQASYPVV